MSRSAPASRRSRSDSSRRWARPAAAGAAATPARGRSRRGADWRRRGCRRDGRDAASAGRRTARSISRASARSVCSSSFTEGGRSEREGEFAERPDQRPFRAHGAEAGMGADQHVVLDAEIGEHAAMLEGPRQAERRDGFGSRARRSDGRRTVIDPTSGRSSPLIRLNDVVLPAPLGPIRLTSSPAPTARSRPLTAITPPKRRVRPVISSSAAEPFIRSPSGLAGESESAAGAPLRKSGCDIPPSGETTPAVRPARRRRGSRRRHCPCRPE